jgi:Ca2+-binding RTX toxin-like protein
MVSTTSAPAGQSFATVYADTIQGQAGNDTLNGGAGADSLAGGTGNDTYVLDNVGDVVFELLGEGEDLIQTSLSHTLAANVENLTLTGSAAVNGTGNELGNVINGNGAANVLSGLDGADQLLGQSGDDRLLGGAGSDTLQGGSGADTLTGGAGVDLYVGGAGKDRFVLEHGASHDDRIQDFAKGDVLQLQGYSAGSTLTKVAGSSTDWKIWDAATNTTEVIHLSNAYNLKGSEFLFG